MNEAVTILRAEYHRLCVIEEKFTDHLRKLADALRVTVDDIIPT